MGATKPPLFVTVFSDYICPFCYIGSRRLLRLGEEYDLKVNWRSVEIHPETPAGGMPIEQLGYDPQRWALMMQALQAMATEEGIALREHDFTTNSRRALLLAEAAKDAGREVFYALHERLFAAFHGEGLNIGEEKVLRGLAEACAVPERLLDKAWQDPAYAARLEDNLKAAAGIRLTGTPTYVIGRQVIPGAVPVEQLGEAAQAAGTQRPPV